MPRAKKTTKAPAPTKRRSSPAAKRSEIVAQQKEAAELLGVTATALRQWMQEPGFPDCSAGYRVDDIRAWQQQRQRKGSAQANDERSVALEIKKAKLKVEQGKALQIGMRIKNDSGELLPRLAWENFAATLLTNLGELCEQLPDLIAGACCEGCAQTVCERLKRELDQWRNDTADDLQTGPRQDS